MHCLKATPRYEPNPAVPINWIGSVLVSFLEIVTDEEGVNQTDIVIFHAVEILGVQQVEVETLVSPPVQ